jgi:hypothetical protein
MLSLLFSGARAVCKVTNFIKPYQQKFNRYIQTPVGNALYAGWTPVFIGLGVNYTWIYYQSQQIIEQLDSVDSWPDRIDLDIRDIRREGGTVAGIY